MEPCKKELNIWIDKKNWFYIGRNKKKFEFVHEVVDNDGNYIQTDLFEVPIDLLADVICDL